MITKKEYFTLWLYKSALLDFQEQRQAIYVLLLMLLVILSQNWILDWVIIAFIWISYHFYFEMWRTAYLLELQKRMDSQYFYTLFIHDRDEFNKITESFNSAIDRINKEWLK